jgi:hypothetical protein
MGGTRSQRTDVDLPKDLVSGSNGQRPPLRWGATAVSSFPTGSGWRG